MDKVYNSISTDLGDELPNINRDEYILKLLGAVPPNYIDLNADCTLSYFNTNRVKKVKERQKKTYITRQEKQKLGLLKCPKTGWKYENFAELRQLWLDYIESYLVSKGAMPEPDHAGWSTFCQLLTKADYHGAELTVVRSKCPNFIGLTGTCVLDTKNTFKILSRDNKCRTIPKADSVFQLKLKDIELTIYGEYFRVRSAERSTKKIKSIIIPDL